MKPLNPEAAELNGILEKEHPASFGLLSRKGREIYFPKKGLLQQGSEARGKHINATIGIAVEDDGSPMRLASIADKISLPPESVFPYASSYGIPPLREAWREQIREKNPSLQSEFSLPVVTNGLSHGLSMCAYLFLDPGDRVILPDIHWENYSLIFENGHDALLTGYTTFTEEGYNVEGLEQALKTHPGKQVILLNFPHNPTGYTLTDAEAELTVRVLESSAAAGNRVLVLLDDAYFGLVYEKGVFRESLFSRLADCHENLVAVKIDGATKEDYAWGFRVAFVTYGSRSLTSKAYAALADKTAGAIRGNVSSDSHLSQSLILNALKSPGYTREKEAKFTVMQDRYNQVVDTLASKEETYTRFFRPLPFNSGYFMCLQLAPSLDAEAVRQQLLQKHDIGVIALGSLLRIAFSSVPVSEIPELFDAVYQACGEIGG